MSSILLLPDSRITKNHPKMIKNFADNQNRSEPRLKQTHLDFDRKQMDFPPEKHKQIPDPEMAGWQRKSNF